MFAIVILSSARIAAIFAKQRSACASLSTGILSSRPMPSCPATNTSRWPAGTAIPWLYRAKGGRIDEGDSARTAIILNGENGRQVELARFEAPLDECVIERVIR